MNKRQKHFVTPLIMLGMLTIILAALAFAEKTREDGHLPERNGQGSGEILSMIALTDLAGSLVPDPRVLFTGNNPLSEHPVLPSPMGMRCSSTI